MGRKSAARVSRHSGPNLTHGAEISTRIGAASAASCEVLCTFGPNRPNLDPSESAAYYEKGYSRRSALWVGCGPTFRSTRASDLCPPRRAPDQPPTEFNQHPIPKPKALRSGFKHTLHLSGPDVGTEAGVGGRRPVRPGSGKPARNARPPENPTPNKIGRLRL